MSSPIQLRRVIISLVAPVVWGAVLSPVSSKLLQSGTFTLWQNAPSLLALFLWFPDCDIRFVQIYELTCESADSCSLPVSVIQSTIQVPTFSPDFKRLLIVHDDSSWPGISLKFRVNSLGMRVYFSTVITVCIGLARWWPSLTRVTRQVVVCLE